MRHSIFAFAVVVGLLAIADLRGHIYGNNPLGER
jgi:hypothetical protein